MEMFTPVLMMNWKRPDGGKCTQKERIQQEPHSVKPTLLLYEYSKGINRS